MIVSINLERLIKSKLNPIEYIICYLIYTKEYQQLKEALSTWITPEQVAELLESLEAKRYLKRGYEKPEEQMDLSKVYIRQPFVDLLGDELSTPFEELREAYPKKTTNGRRLHTNLQVAKKKYLEFLRGRMALHPLILKAVTFEYKERIRQDSLNYMLNIASYIHQKGWEAFMDDVLKQEEQKGTGESVIEQEGESSNRTRIL